MAFDSIVVGAGIEGSATAYQFAKKGYNTLLLEQFPLPHSRGSSHGQSRIIRCAYEQTYFAHMVMDAMAMWKQLEIETNTQIFKKTGLLYGESVRPHNKYKAYLTAIQSVNRPYHVYTGTEVNQRYHGAVQYDEDYKGYIEVDAGLLKADKALRAYQDQFLRYDGTLHDEERVTSVIPGDIITVVTNKGRYKTRRLVLAVGAWASKMLRPLGLDFPLEVQRINVCYWKSKKPRMYNNFPCFMHDAFKNKELLYGLPSHEYPGLMKVCYHGGTAISCPEERDRCKSREDVKIIRNYIREFMPGLKDEPAIVESCMYSVTPDHIPIIGTHPHYPNLAFVCGMSGSGFKLAPVIGKLMCELLTRQPLSHDLSHFNYERFFKNSVSERNKKPPVQAKL